MHIKLTVFGRLGRYFVFRRSPASTGKETVISSLGAGGAIVMIGWVSSWVVENNDLPLLVASMGAAAVLLFAAPQSDMAQPWSLFIGHVVSALVGVSCAKYIPDLLVAGGVAVGGAIFCMHLTRSLHPPGGAAALVAVIGGESIQGLGYLYVLVPVGLNVLIIYIVALVINNLIAGKPYPGRVHRRRITD